MSTKDDPVAQTTPTFWLDAGVMRGLIAAIISLAALVASAFGVDEKFLSAQASKAVEPLLTIINFASLLYIGWARAKRPTPPLTLTKPEPPKGDSA